MKNLSLAVILFLISLIIAFLVYLIINDNNNDFIDGKIDTLIIKDSVQIETYIPIQDILFLTKDKVPLKNDPTFNATTKDILRINSIYYIKKRGNLDSLKIKGKLIQDFWYQISDHIDNSGWVFGHYTSKAIK